MNRGLIWLVLEEHVNQQNAYDENLSRCLTVDDVHDGKYGGVLVVDVVVEVVDVVCV